MEAFLGKWQSSGDIDNLDAYLATINKPELKEGFKAPHIYEVSVSGDTVTYGTIAPDNTRYTVTSKLGEKVKGDTVFKKNTESCTMMENNEMVVKQDCGAFQQEMRSRVQNGKLIMDTTANGVTMTERLVKM